MFVKRARWSERETSHGDAINAERDGDITAARGEQVDANCASGIELQYTARMLVKRIWYPSESEQREEKKKTLKID